MKSYWYNRIFSKVVILGAFALPQLLSAQTFFTYDDTAGEALLGFRKTGVNQGNFEMVVNIGGVTNLEALSPGSTINITQYAPSQLLDAFPDGFGNLQWSSITAFNGNSLGQFPKYTLWYTLPRTNASIQTPAPARRSQPSQGSVIRPDIVSVGDGAVIISENIGSTNSDNNQFLVLEPSGDPNAYTAFVSDPFTPSIADFGGEIFPQTIENTTPNTFSTAVVSDLYRFVANGFVDPNSGLTTGSAYFVGFFTLKPDGTMTFTRASANLPPPVLSITRAGTTSTVSFGTTSGGTYTLYYTNSAGLKAPISTWTASPTTVAGNGNTNSIMDTTTDSNRVYRVGVH
jgi:hypothetical protein